MTPRLRNWSLSAVLFVVLALGALNRIERFNKEARANATLTLGGLARELATEKQTFDVVLEKLGAGRNGFGLMGELQKSALASAFKLGNYDALDAMPSMTLAELDQGLGLLASQRGAPTFAPLPAPVTEPLGIPTGKAPLTGEPFLKPLELGLSWGDRLDLEKAKRGPDSERLAQVLEGLSLGTLRLERVESPKALMESLIKAGHAVQVRDERYAANFGDLERNGRGVATPLWVSTGREVKGAALLLPVPHAQLVVEVRGPEVNADVTFFPSLDLAGDGSGGARFRADVTKDQTWCLGRVAHVYDADKALRAVELMGLMRRGLETKVREGALPLDGYFALGVCTLAPAVVEQSLLGTTTLWPLTHDPARFSSDSQLDALVRALPHDGRGAPAPGDERLQGALPWKTLEAVPFPVLRDQLKSLGWLR